MTATKTKPSKNGKPKQTFLPGMKPPSHADLDNLADDFYEAKAEEKLAKKNSEDKADLLHAKMQSKRLKTYRTANGRWVHVTNTEKVKVTKATEDEKVTVGEKGAGNG